MNMEWEYLDYVQRGGTLTYSAWGEEFGRAEEDEYSTELDPKPGASEDDKTY